jgi:hypothetical protein
MQRKLLGRYDKKAPSAAMAPSCFCSPQTTTHHAKHTQSTLTTLNGVRTAHDHCSGTRSNRFR